MASNQGKHRRRHTVYKDGPRAVDVHVGKRVRERRVLCGLSQAELGDLVGLTFQQIQKYERGANRISASRLWEFSLILHVKVEWFFDGLDKKGNPIPGDDASASQETLQLVRYFTACPEKVRKYLLVLFVSIARNFGNAGPSRKK